MQKFLSGCNVLTFSPYSYVFSLFGKALEFFHSFWKLKQLNLFKFFLIFELDF